MFSNTWKFKPFAQKELTGLEGRSIDVDKLKILVQSPIADGGFSNVYLARDSINISKQYALKHMICNDEESLELVRKEISVMESLKGHPNIVSLHAYSVLDVGRTKEALLVMELCEKSLVSVLEARGAGYFEEKQILSIFRDICNAVFAMHCQYPPIAHRDLKAENLLLGNDGLWKLCDFGSTSTNHKRFEKPEEMGIEEDIIRKHTTPPYRAPEMWDLFRKDLINEKVDVWALGCLLFRICYLKNAFDGDSKLQILNGNYRIPDVPRYSTALTHLIRDMLQSSPDNRPDIMQVWNRVNDQLPVSIQKPLPDKPPGMQASGFGHSVGHMKVMNRTSHHIGSLPSSPAKGGNGGPIGAFWTTQHAKNPHPVEEIEPITIENRARSDPQKLSKKVTQSSHGNDQESMNARSREAMESEIKLLREQLKKAELDKAEITVKCESLSSICHSQGRELLELKQALAVRSACLGGETKQLLPCTEPGPWRAFADDSNHNELQDPAPKTDSPPSAKGLETEKQHAQWGFESDTFVASVSRNPEPSSPLYRANAAHCSERRRVSPTRPAGWAGF